MNRDVENATLCVYWNKTTLLLAPAEYYENYIRFSFSLTILNGSSLSVTLTMVLRTEQVAVTMPFGSVFLVAGPLDWIHSDIHFPSTLSTESLLQIELTPYDKFDNPVDPEYLMPCLMVSVSFESEYPITMLPPAVSSTSPATSSPTEIMIPPTNTVVKTPQIRISMMVTSVCTLLHQSLQYFLS